MKGIAASERFSSSGINVCVRHVYSCLINIYPEYEKISKLKAVPYFGKLDDLKFKFNFK